MKLSKDLFYGIIIGILLVACTGSIKQDKAEFKEEKIHFLGTEWDTVEANLAKYKKEGWTIIDFETAVQGDYIMSCALAGR